MRFIRFIIYGLAGWCVEIFWTGLGSLLKGDITLHGWTYIWMFPIYGLLIFAEPIHDKIREWPAIFRGGVYALLILTTEFVTGTLLCSILGSCPWIYEDTPYTINGIIRLDYAPFWFIAGLLFEKLHDILIEMMNIKYHNEI
ncbi:hypothetical protein ACFIJ5_17060 [Haloimpatiens sp. FM7330]|uniref:putative ABC transporter permease n=1 Tax=Haloimpatiens sp. FM7330 TaxID=3298610 RepID=UPI00362EE5D8